MKNIILIYLYIQYQNKKTFVEFIKNIIKNIIKNLKGDNYLLFLIMHQFIKMKIC